MDSTRRIVRLRGVILLTSLWIAVAGIACESRKAPVTGTRPPNLVIILADDLGYDDLGCYWTPSDRKDYAKIETANIDRLADEGMLFTDFYAGAPVCTPSRAALLTGCYPSRISLSNPSDTTGIIDKHSDLGMHPDETTIAEFLSARGYITACVGKWHLGVREPFLPTRQGFDVYYGLLHGQRFENNYLMRGETVIDTIGFTELTDLYTAEAIRFIKQNKDHAFFLYLSHNAPHVPLPVSARFAGTSARGRYGDAVMNLDWSTGEVLRALHEAGLEENTLVIFTSDNGPAIAKDARGGECFPLRGGKGGVFEGGIRVPCLMRWSGRIPAGSRCTDVATFMDFFPTFAHLLGVDSPTAKPIDGRDISRLMFGSAQSLSPPETLFYYANGNLRAVRQGRWKLHFRYKNGHALPGPLFDLDADIGETTNVASKHRDHVEHLAALAARMRKELGDAGTHTRGTAQRPRARALDDGSIEDVYSDLD